MAVISLLVITEISRFSSDAIYYPDDILSMAIYHQDDILTIAIYNNFYGF